MGDRKPIQGWKVHFGTKRGTAFLLKKKTFLYIPVWRSFSSTFFLFYVCIMLSIFVISRLTRASRSSLLLCLSVCGESLSKVWFADGVTGILLSIYIMREGVTSLWEAREQFRGYLDGDEGLRLVRLVSLVKESRSRRAVYGGVGDISACVQTFCLSP